jgi:MFS transporter, DHA1 family, inner membrane transport protein
MSQVASGRTESAAALEGSLARPAALLAFGTAVVVTTEFIVVGLLPAMARDLGISLAEAGWFVSKAIPRGRARGRGARTIR